MTFNRSRVLMFMVLLVGTLAAVGSGSPASAAPGAPAAPQGVGDASCSAPAPHGFSDVPTNYFANTAIAWLVEAGITTGTTPTTFSPNNQVTRAEMAVFLWRNTCARGLDSPTLSLAAGGRHTCAVRDDATVDCWGWNTSGELGDGTTTQRNTPTPVIGLTDVTAISTGDHHSCALINNGTAKWAEALPLVNGTPVTVFAYRLQPMQEVFDGEQAVWLKVYARDVIIRDPDSREVTTGVAIGRVGQDAEMKFLPTGQSLTNVSIATDYGIWNAEKNAWDNETTWLDWDLLQSNADIHRFFRLMIAFRKRHPSLGRNHFWREDVRWFGVEGEPDLSWYSHSVAFFLSGASLEDSDLYVMINAWEEDLVFKIQVGEPAEWRRVVDTARPSPGDITEAGVLPAEKDSAGAEHTAEKLTSDRVKVETRSIVVLERRSRNTPRRQC